MFKYFIAILLLTLSTNVLAISDTNCMIMTIYYESNGEPIAGQRAVADVIQNRMRMREMNACAVMKEKAQFSFYPKKIKQKMDLGGIIKALEVMDMESVVSDNTLYFHATYVNPKWKKNLRRVARIKNHIFYEEKTQWISNSQLATK